MVTATTMTAGDVSSRHRSSSNNPFSRIAHKLAHLKGDSPLRASQSQPDHLEKTAIRNAASARGSRDFERRNKGAEPLELRDGIQSDSDVRSPFKGTGVGTGTASPSTASRQSSQTTRSQPSKIIRDDEEPEPRESLDRYGSDSSETLAEPEKILSVAQATEQAIGETVTFRARIHTQRRMSRFLDFILFRDQTDTIQGVLSRAHPNITKKDRLQLH